MVKLFLRLIRANAAAQLAALAISICIIGFTYAFAEEIGLKTKPSTEPITPTGITRSGTRSRERVEAEMITLTPNGFEPTEISRPQGPFLLALFNHSGLEEISLELKRDNGSSIRSIIVPKRRTKFREGMDLVPGRYVLTEANHPEWIDFRQPADPLRKSSLTLLQVPIFSCCISNYLKYKGFGGASRITRVCYKTFCHDGNGFAQPSVRKAGAAAMRGIPSISPSSSAGAAGPLRRRTHTDYLTTKVLVRIDVLSRNERVVQPTIAPHHQAVNTRRNPCIRHLGGESFAFATKVTNAVNHSTFAQYDYFLGRVSSMRLAALLLL